MSLIEIKQPVQGLVQKAIGNLLDLTVEDDWFGEASNLLNFSEQVIKGFEHVRALSFYVLHRNWDDLELDQKKKHGFGFWEYALSVADREQGTVQSWIRTAELWLVNKPVQRVTVLERVNGRPVRNEQGELITKEVMFDPLHVPMSKLLRCNSRRDSMDDTLWEMLADDYYTCRDIMAYTSNGSQAPEYRYILEGTGIFKEVGAQLYHICDLNFEDYNDPHVEGGIKTLFQCLGVKTDEEIIADILHRTYRKGAHAFNGDREGVVP